MVARKHTDDQQDLETVLDLCRRMDRSAQSRLYHRYAPKVFGILYGMLGPNPDVEDLVQLAWVDLFRGLKSFEGRSSFETWMYRVVVNVAYRHLSKRKRFFQILEIFQREDIQDNAMTPYDHLQSKQEVQTLYRVLDQVSPKKRAVYVLFELEGKGGDEIAEIVGCTENTVWTRLFHARKEVTRKLHKHRLKKGAP